MRIFPLPSLMEQEMKKWQLLFLCIFLQHLQLLQFVSSFH